MKLPGESLRKKDRAMAASKSAVRKKNGLTKAEGCTRHLCVAAMMATVQTEAMSDMDEAFMATGEGKYLVLRQNAMLIACMPTSTRPDAIFTGIKLPSRVG